MKDATCPLCLSYGPVCDSHIIPRALFKKVVGSEQFAIAASTKHANTWANRNGFHEPMLCKACESLTKRYEDYAMELLDLDGPGWSIESVNTEPHHKVARMWLNAQADPESLLLFFAQLLFKAHHAQHDSMDDVDLGQYEPLIRQCLVEERLLTKLAKGLGVTFLALQKVEGAPEAQGLMSPPIKHQHKKGGTYYSVLLPGFQCYVRLSNYRHEEMAFLELTSESTKLRIPEVVFHETEAFQRFRRIMSGLDPKKIRLIQGNVR